MCDRTRICNQLATSGAQWADLFSIHASGTYANQWMVIDFQRFVPGITPVASSGVLTVLEELPGHTHWEDMTHYLSSQGYWPSYNSPFFADTRELSGSLALCEAPGGTGALFCYSSDPRALIIHAQQAAVIDIPSLERFMGYNQFRTDFMSLNDSCNAIACRQDLEPDVTLQYPFGALDGKVSSIRLSYHPSDVDDDVAATLYNDDDADVAATLDDHDNVSSIDAKIKTELDNHAQSASSLRASRHKGVIDSHVTVPSTQADTHRQQVVIDVVQ